MAREFEAFFDMERNNVKVFHEAQPFKWNHSRNHIISIVGDAVSVIVSDEAFDDQDGNILHDYI